jgi:hypothetical protein
MRQSREAVLNLLDDQLRGPVIACIRLQMEITFQCDP